MTPACYHAGKVKQTLVYRVSLKKKYDILSNFYEKLVLYFEEVSNGEL